MSQYTVVHSCGHNQNHQLYGPSKDRARKATWLETVLCSQCRREEISAQHAEDAVKAAEEAKEVGLPDLHGSEKQISWALQIRGEFLTKITNHNGTRNGLDLMSKAFYYQLLPLSKAEWEGRERTKEILPALQEAITSFTYEAVGEINAAHWWIDNRHDLTVSLLNKTAARLDAVILGVMQGKAPEEVAESQAAAAARLAEESRLELAIRQESTVYPAEKSNELPVEISCTAKEVTIKTMSANKSIAEMLKKLGFSWGGFAWNRSCMMFSDGEDRAAETGRRLLAAGCPFLCLDANVRTRAVSGEIKPEIRRCLAAKDNRFRLWWHKNDNWFDGAKEIKGSRWESPFMWVPADAYEAVEDFAKTHDFMIAGSADKLIAEMRGLEASRFTAAVNAIEIPDPEEYRATPPLLTVPASIEVPTGLLDSEDD